MSETAEVEAQEPEKKKPMSSAERVRRMNAAKKAKKAAKADKLASTIVAVDHPRKTDKFEYAARTNCICSKRLAKLRGETEYSCMRVWMDDPTPICQRNLPEKNKDGTWRIYSESNIHLAPRSKREESGELED